MKKRLTSMEILSHLGMIGSTISSNSLVPRAETPAALERQRVDFFDSGNIANPDVWSKYASVMKRPASLENQLLLWEDMATWDLIAAALTQIVDEVCQTDTSNPRTLWYECNNSEVEEACNDLLDQIDAETKITSQTWYITALGNSFEKLDYSRGEGVRGLSFVHPFEIRRYWLERNRQCIGFKWRERLPNREDIFTLPDNTTPIERVALSSGTTIEDLWYPWDFLHFRRMFRSRLSENGEPLYDEAQGIFKKLRLAIDQMVVFRAQVQPDRYVVNIDTQELPPTEQMRTVQRWKQSLRNKISFGQGGDPGVFSDPNEFKSFYNPLALDTIIYMARPKGFTHSIDKLNGTMDVPDVFDIELLVDLFYSIIGMPKTWFGLGQTEGAPPSGKSLLAQDIRFLRKVKSIRRPLINGYTWLAYFHMLLKGHDISTLNIQAKMPDIGGLEDQMKMELVRAQAEILQMLGDVMQQYNLPKEAWIQLIFDKYLHLPDDVVNVFLTSLPPEREPMPMESQRPTPSERVLLQEVQSRITAEAIFNLKNLVRRYHGIVTETAPACYRGKNKRNSIIVPLRLFPGDRARVDLKESAVDVQLRTTPSVSRTTVITETKTENGSFQPAWRRYIKPKSNVHA